MALACRIGTSDMVSTPPQSTTSPAPAAMCPMAVVIAALEEMQAIVTVWAGSPWG